MARNYAHNKLRERWWVGGAYVDLLTYKSQRLRAIDRLLRELYGDGCGICGKRVPARGEPCAPGLQPSIDHILGPSLGGCNCFANLQLAHHSCNVEKQKREQRLSEMLSPEQKQPMLLSTRQGGGSDAECRRADRESRQGPRPAPYR